MKKSLSLTNNSGFVLPYVMFIATFVMIILSANIQTYQLDIQLTEQHIEQLKIGTILQMGHQLVKTDLINNNELKNISYSFPDGTLKAKITQLDENRYHIYKHIVTKNKSKYTIISYLELN